MGQRLTKMEIERVDLVDAGANARRLAVFKRADAAAGAANIGEAFAAGLAQGATPASPAPEAPAPSFLEKVGSAVAKALGIGPDGEPIAKAASFGELIAGREMTQALEENFWVLSDALWSATYAVDDNGADLTTAAKQALVAKSLDEFKAWLIGVMQAGIGKRAEAPGPGVLIEGLVAKVGRKISAARLTRLQEAASALTDVLNEVEAADATAPAEKRASAEEDQMTPAELDAAIDARIAKANETPETPETPAATPSPAIPAAAPAAVPAAAATEPEATLGDVVTAIGKLAERVEAIEKTPGQPTAIQGQDGPVKKGSGWGSVFGITH